MKASELIKELQQLINDYGDQPVNFDGGDIDYAIDDATAYDELGNAPTLGRPAAEFFLHRSKAIRRDDRGQQYRD